MNECGKDSILKVQSVAEGKVQSVAEESLSKEPVPNGSRVPVKLWRGSVVLFALELLIGLGLATALVRGWRSPTPHRAPDWTTSELVWQQLGDGTGTISNEGYQMRLSQPGQHIWSVTDLSLSDLEIELVVRPSISSADVGYGLLYRYQDTDNHYLFAISSDGYYSITRVEAGEPATLRPWQQWPHVRRGAAANRMRVRCKEALCRLYINDEFTAEITDDRFQAGKIGLWAQSFSDSVAQVAFENVRVWSLNR